MVTYGEFLGAAPRIGEIFGRRHAATGNLCFLGTVRADGAPRISPMEPRVFEGQLVLEGMPGTVKFRDLEREPRFCLHTATVDTHVSDGDVKLWGSVVDVRDENLHRRFAEDLFEQSGFDIRGQEFGHYYVADISSASAVEVGDGHMDVTIWKVGEAERVVRKH